ncbi:MAG: glycosyltransferase family 4 protein, partial [Planctomycetota bacterium]
MSKKQRDSRTQAPEKKLVRPALIVSERTVSEYTLLLGRILVGLADESIHAALVCPMGCKVDSVVSGAVEVMRYPALKLPVLWRQEKKRLVEQLLRFKPTVLHCLCESKSGLTRQLARQLDLPYVLTVNSMQKRWRHFVFQERMHPLSLSSKHCAKIIVPAESIGANIAEVWPRFAGRIEQINIGTFVGEGSGCFCEVSRLASMVTALALDDVGAFEDLFSAVRHLVIDRYEFMFVVIGGGRAEGGLRRLLAALDLLPIVTIVPRLKPWRSVLAAGDIFIRPTVSTAFNPLLLEAMSVGAAVAGCKGGVDDLIIEDQTAVVFDPDDELSIYGSLQQLFNKREWARQLARGAQQYLRENHTVSNMISSTLRTYRDAEQWY